MSDRPYPIGDPPNDDPVPAPDPDDDDDEDYEDDGPFHPALGRALALSRHAVTAPVGQIATLLIEHVSTLETSLNDPAAQAASAVALAQRAAMTVLELYARARPDQPATPLAVGTLLGCGMDLALKEAGGRSNELLAATKRITIAVDDRLRAGRGLRH